MTATACPDDALAATQRGRLRKKAPEKKPATKARKAAVAAAANGTVDRAESSEPRAATRRSSRVPVRARTAEKRRPPGPAAPEVSSDLSSVLGSEFGWPLQVGTAAEELEARVRGKPRTDADASASAPADVAAWADVSGDADVSALADVSTDADIYVPVRPRTRQSVRAAAELRDTTDVHRSACHSEGKRKGGPAKSPPASMPESSRTKKVRFLTATVVERVEPDPDVAARPQYRSVRDILHQLAESAANNRDSLGGQVIVGGPTAADDPEDTSALRRMSVATRGKRASVLAQENILSLPHPDIPVELYYKHTEATAPPPHRMSQLIAWSVKKVKPDLPKAETERHEDLIAAILDGVVKDMLSGKINISWYDNEKPAKYGKEPHPRNIHDKKKLEEDERAVKELTVEHDRWLKLLEQYNRAHAEASDAKALQCTAGVTSDDVVETRDEPGDGCGDADDVLKRFAKISVQVDRLRARLVSAEAYVEAVGTMCESRMRYIMDALDARRGETCTDLRRILQAN